MRPAHPLRLAILQSAPIWVVPPTLTDRLLSVKSSREAGDRMLVKFAELAGKTQARELVGRELVVERSQVPTDLMAQFDQMTSETLDEEDYGLGLQIHSDNYGHLGQVTEVIETGANLVWVIDSPRYGEVLLPVIDDCILEVDNQAGTAKVTVMEGLIDED